MFACSGFGAFARLHRISCKCKLEFCVFVANASQTHVSHRIRFGSLIRHQGTMGHHPKKKRSVFGESRRLICKRWEFVRCELQFQRHLLHIHTKFAAFVQVKLERGLNLEICNKAYQDTRLFTYLVPRLNSKLSFWMIFLCLQLFDDLPKRCTHLCNAQVYTASSLSFFFF